LIVRLIALDRKATGVPDDRTTHGGIGISKSHDRGVIASGDIYERVSQAKAVTKFTDRCVVENACPSKAVILLLVILVGTLT
jgi:hypothetical protein